jgi:hypothetical protein
MTPTPLGNLSDWHIEVLYRIAKRKLRPFFADPRAMKILREERDRRAGHLPPLVLPKKMRRK